MTGLLYKDEVYAISGAAMEVYNELGAGFLEPVYQEALEIELKQRGISYTARQELSLHYKGIELKKTYVADLVAYENIVVELKAIDQLTPRETSQLLNYLKVTGLPVGLLINFGHKDRLDRKQMILTSKNSPLRN